MQSPGKTILIFDDDEDILSICSYILEERGWTVHTLITCNNILEQVKTLQPTAILMDNWIPDEGGVNATQKLKASEQLKSIPVINFSANSDIKNIAKEAGADTYLAKPFDLEALESTIISAISST